MTFLRGIPIVLLGIQLALSFLRDITRALLGIFQLPFLRDIPVALLMDISVAVFEGNSICHF